MEFLQLSQLQVIKHQRTEDVRITRGPRKRDPARGVCATLLRSLDKQSKILLEGLPIFLKFLVTIILITTKIIDLIEVLRN